MALVTLKQGNGLNLTLLAERIELMTRETQLYKTLKTALSKQGYWKNKARGKAGFKGKVG